MTEIVQWLGINSILPLAPIGFFYLGVLLIKGKKSFRWVPPIRDGQICFYSTTVAIIAIKDIGALQASGILWLFGLIGCWFVSFFVYSISVYSTIYPSGDKTDAEAIDRRVAWASIFCGILTTAMVIGLRLHYGVLK
jgi:hypothetical protein